MDELRIHFTKQDWMDDLADHQYAGPIKGNRIIIPFKRDDWSIGETHIMWCISAEHLRGMAPMKITISEAYDLRGRDPKLLEQLYWMTTVTNCSPENDRLRDRLSASLTSNTLNNPKQLQFKLNYGCQHEWVDTGMRRSWCKHCDQDGVLNMETGTYE